MKIAIIGAWAAGMMAMATLIEWGFPGKDILLFDGNDRMGRKVALTGGGRCNVTTAITKKKELLPKYIRGSEFLEDAFGAFSPKKCREWFESHRIPLKEEDHSRLFPISDNGWDIVAPFEKIAASEKVDLHFREKVGQISRADTEFFIQTEKENYTADICIITTGGNTYSKTGSSGDGYEFARNFGHTITPLGPSLSSFLTSEHWGHTISGLVLPNAALSVSVSGKQIQTSGGLLFTHFGISGPVAFALSAHLAFETISDTAPISIRINADANKTREVWESEIITAFKNHPTKTVRNILPFLVVRRYADSISEKIGSISEKTATTVSKEERKSIVELLFSMPLTLIGRRPGDEFVTAGWVSTDEINAKTMESQLIPWLYFAGEILNIDAVTGGFNLQGCWATGYSAGKWILNFTKSL